MQQHGKYYITLKGVHYEVSQEVHDGVLLILAFESECKPSLRESFSCTCHSADHNTSESDSA